MVGVERQGVDWVDLLLAHLCPPVALESIPLGLQPASVEHRCAPACLRCNAPTPRSLMGLAVQGCVPASTAGVAAGALRHQQASEHACRWQRAGPLAPVSPTLQRTARPCPSCMHCRQACTVQAQAHLGRRVQVKVLDCHAPLHGGQRKASAVREAATAARLRLEAAVALLLAQALLQPALALALLKPVYGPASEPDSSVLAAQLVHRTGCPVSKTRGAHPSARQERGAAQLTGTWALCDAQHSTWGAAHRLMSYTSRWRVDVAAMSLSPALVRLYPLPGSMMCATALEPCGTAARVRLVCLWHCTCSAAALLHCQDY